MYSIRLNDESIPLGFTSMEGALSCLNTLSKIHPNLEYDPEPDVNGNIYVATESFLPMDCDLLEEEEVAAATNRFNSSILIGFSPGVPALTFEHDGNVQVSELDLEEVYLITEEDDTNVLEAAYIGPDNRYLSFRGLRNCFLLPTEVPNRVFHRPGTRNTAYKGPGSCAHKYVNVGFSSIRMACRFCGRDE